MEQIKYVFLVFALGISPSKNISFILRTVYTALYSNNIVVYYFVRHK